MFIKDEALRDAVARNLRTTPEELTPEMMTGLIHLEVPDMEIKSLEGLEYAENLEYLDASGNSIQSLEPIRDLRNVLTLDVSSNQLRDIQALHGFRQLKKLNISRNNLYTMDISSIAGMLHLEVLDLKRAKIDSLEYIIHCKSCSSSISTPKTDHSTILCWER